MLIYVINTFINHVFLNDNEINSRNKHSKEINTVKTEKQETK